MVPRASRLEPEPERWESRAGSAREYAVSCVLNFSCGVIVCVEDALLLFEIELPHHCLPPPLRLSLIKYSQPERAVDLCAAAVRTCMQLSCLCIHRLRRPGMSDDMSVD